MKLKTVRMRRSSPSTLAFALALMLTMLCVYFLSLSIQPKSGTKAAAIPEKSSAEIRMEGLDVAFLVEARSKNQLEARVLAARCAQNGGAGLILSDNGNYTVVREAVPPDKAGTNDLHRSATGLSLKLSGNSAEIAAISDAVAILRALAAETGALAGSIENGDTDIASVCSLLEVYRTQVQKALDGIQPIAGSGAIPKRLADALLGALGRLNDAMAKPDISKIKLIHAAACGEWISLLDDFSAEGTQPSVT